MNQLNHLNFVSFSDKWWIRYQQWDPFIPKQNTVYMRRSNREVVLTPIAAQFKQVNHLSFYDIFHGLIALRSSIVSF